MKRMIRAVLLVGWASWLGLAACDGETVGDDDVGDDDATGDDDTGDDDTTADLVEPIVLVDDPLLDVWQFSSGLAGGHPALVWYHNDWEGGDYRLYFLRSNDAGGTDWPDQDDSVLLPTGGLDVGWFELLQLADGTPLIFCSHGEGNDNHLSVLRAQDAAGTAWDEPVVVDASHWSASEISVALVGDIPAVAYTSDDHLIYVRAEDATGESWFPAVTAASAVGDFGRVMNKDLAVVNGRPAVAYRHADDMDNTRDVYYVRASDALGDAWEVPVLIDEDDYRGVALDLEWLDGAPLLLYGSEGGEVVLAQGEDADGDSWGVPWTADQRGFLWQMVTVDPAVDEGAVVQVVYSQIEWDQDRADQRQIQVIQRIQEVLDSVLVGAAMFGVDYDSIKYFYAYFLAGQLSASEWFSEVDKQLGGRGVVYKSYP